MNLLATLFRAAQFYAHRAHNLVSGPSFLSDHEFLGSLYDTYADTYDSIIERLISLGESVEPNDILRDATDIACQANDGQSSFFFRLLSTEKQLRSEIDKILRDRECSEGTKNFLQGLADESEQRSYKIAQRDK